jgi:uncharacterized membrane protein YkoI
MKKRMIFPTAVFLTMALLTAGCSMQDTDSGSENVPIQESENTAETVQQDDASSQKISREEAVQIVLSRVEGAQESDIHELETDQDDGQFVYEGELVFNGYEYDFEIDGVTGEIIQWEIDRE